MTCRSCGATIADKAIVCYRCGTPTADPASLTPQRPPPAAPFRVWLIVVVVMFVASAFWLVPRLQMEAVPRLLLSVAVLVIALVGLRFARRR